LIVWPAAAAAAGQIDAAEDAVTVTTTARCLDRRLATSREADVPAVCQTYL